MSPSSFRRNINENNKKKGEYNNNNNSRSPLREEVTIDLNKSKSWGENSNVKSYTLKPSEDNISSTQ